MAATSPEQTRASGPRTVIGVDPSDSGEGDAAGILAASLTTSGTVVVHRDVSEPMTPERWARAAIELAIDTGASEIAVETFTAREGYLSVLNTALRRYRLPHPMRVSSWPPKGSDRGRGDAMARSAKLIQGLETGTSGWPGTCQALRLKPFYGRQANINQIAWPRLPWRTTYLCTALGLSRSPRPYGLRSVPPSRRRGCAARSAAVERGRGATCSLATLCHGKHCGSGLLLLPRWAGPLAGGLVPPDC